MMLDSRIDEADISEWLRNEWKGQQVVATNGCFDVIHSGHIDYLYYAYNQGDILVVGLNGDESVRKLKGENRPINNVADRAKILSALFFVDWIYVFEEMRAINFIKTIKPDVYVKAEDYSMESLNEKEKKALDDIGTEIVFAPFTEGKSTTKTLDSLKI